MKYNAFISYSHANKELPKAIQSGLRLLANPWFKLEALKVFRDVSNLSASPELWPDIEKALHESEFFILLASPESAKSKWVKKEIEYWIEHKPKGTLLLALVNGEVVWDETICDFDWAKTTAIPEVLRGSFTDEPNYANFLKFLNSKDVTLDNVEFQEEIAKLAAPLHKRSVGELIGQQEQEYRRKIRLRNSAITSLFGLLLAAMLFAGLFYKEWNQAKLQLAANQLGVAALKQERIDPTISVIKLLEGFKMSGDSSLYSLATNVYNRNYTYDQKIQFLRNAMADVSNGGYITISKDNKFTITKTDNTLKGNLQNIVADDKISKLQLSNSGDFFIIKLNKSGRIYLISSVTQQPVLIEGVDAVFDNATGDIFCLMSSGEVLRYFYRSHYRNIVRISQIKDKALLNELSSSEYISIAMSAGCSDMLVNHTALSLVSMNTGEIINIEKNDPGPYNVFAISKSGKYVAVDSSFQIIIYKDGKRERSLRGHRNYIVSLEFSPSSDDILISTSLDMTGAIYNLDTDDRKELLGHLATPHAQFSSDGLNFITYDTTSVLFWPLVQYPQKVLAESSAGYKSVKISPKNKYLAAADMDGRLWLWTFDGTVILDSVMISEEDIKERIVFDKSDDILYAVSKKRNSILAYYIKEKKIVEKFQSPLEKVYGIVMSGRNELIAYSDSGKILKPSGSGKLLLATSIRKESMNIMSATSKEDLLYVCNDEGHVLILSTQGEIIDTVKYGDVTINVQGVDISNTSSYMAIIGNSGNIKLYTEKQNLFDTVPVRADYCMDIKFLNNSNYFVSTSDDQQVRAWDIQGREIASYSTGAISIIYSIDVSSDDRYMATADDRRVLFWRLRKPITQFL